MKPDNQNIEQPDYSFITNQPVGPAQKKTDKKMVIIIVLLIILAILGVASVVLSNTEKSVKEQKSTATTTKTETVDVVDEFLKRAGNNDVEGAYSLFSADSEITKEVFTKENMLFLGKMKLNECKPKDEEPRTDEEGRTLKSYICYSKANNFEFEFEFTIVKAQDGSQKILVYILVISDEE